MKTRFASLLTCILLTFFPSFAQAQTSAVDKASKFRMANDFDKAIRYIEKAVKHVKTGDSEYAWGIYGRVYDSVFRGSYGNESTFNERYDKVALQKAVEGYHKCIGFSLQNNRYKTMANTRLDSLYSFLLNKGTALYQAGRYTAALEAFQNARVARPRYHTAYIYAAATAQEMDRPELALQNYHELLKLGYAKNADVHKSVIFLIQQVEQDLEAALSETEKAIALFPEDVDLRQEHINLLLQLNRKEKAFKKLTRALAADPQNPVLLYNMAWLHYKFGETEKALKGYRATLKLNPRHYKALYNLGTHYYNLAAEQYSKAGKLPETDPSGQREKLLAQALKNMQIASPWLEAAAEIQKSGSSLWMALYSIYNLTGETEKAQTALQHYQRLTGG